MAFGKAIWFWALEAQRCRTIQMGRRTPQLLPAFRLYVVQHIGSGRAPRSGDLPWIRLLGDSARLFIAFTPNGMASNDD
jgi:hypothetical protein